MTEKEKSEMYSLQFSLLLPVRNTHCVVVRTLFENHPKLSHLSVPILAFPINFCPIKIDLSGNIV